MILFRKLINCIIPGTIPKNALTTKQKLNRYEILQNQGAVLVGARAIGAQITNMGADDLAQGTVRIPIFSFL